MPYIRKGKRVRVPIMAATTIQITGAMEEYREMLVALAEDPKSMDDCIVRDESGRPTGQVEWQDYIEASAAELERSKTALRGKGKSVRSMARHLGIVVDLSDGYPTDTGGRAVDLTVRRMYTGAELSASPRPSVSELLKDAPSEKVAVADAMSTYLLDLQAKVKEEVDSFNSTLGDDEDGEE